MHTTTITTVHRRPIYYLEEKIWTERIKLLKSYRKDYRKFDNLLKFSSYKDNIIYCSCLI